MPSPPRPCTVASLWHCGAAAVGDEKLGPLTCSVHSTQPALQLPPDGAISSNPAVGRRLNCRLRRQRRYRDGVGSASGSRRNCRQDRKLAPRARVEGSKGVRSRPWLVSQACVLVRRLALASAAARSPLALAQRGDPEGPARPAELVEPAPVRHIMEIWPVDGGCFR